MAESCIEPKSDSVRQTGRCKLCQVLGWDNVATHWCDDCNWLICGDCVTKHKQEACLRSHVLQKVATTDAGLFCEAHPEQSATYWCDTCSSPVCTACVIYKHDGHQKNDIAKYISQFDADVQSLQVTLSNLKVSFLSKLSVINDMVSNLDAYAAVSKEDIRSSCFVLMKEIKKSEQELIKKLTESHQYKSDNLKNEAHQLDRDIDEVNNWLDTTSVDNRHVLPRQINLVIDGKRLIARKSVNIPKTDFIEFKLNKNVPVGKLKESRGCLNKKPMWRMQGKENDEIRHVIFCSDTTLALLYNKFIELYYLRADHSIPLKVSQLKLIPHVMWRMALSGFTLYVTCSHSICNTVHQFTIRDDSLVASTNQWPKNMFTYPSGIAVTGSQNIIVADFKKRQVTMHNSDGRILLTFAEEVLFLTPAYVSCGTEEVIVSDLDTHYVYVFDMTGKLTASFGGRGHENDKLNQPRGICIDKKNNILVADYWNKRISQFDKFGNFICHILNDNFAELNAPRAIARREIGQKTLLLISHIDQTNTGLITMYEI